MVHQRGEVGSAPCGIAHCLANDAAQSLGFALVLNCAVK
jgi:hypothetical protein